MRIQYHYIHLDSTPAIEEYAAKRLAALDHLLVHLDPDGTALLALELARTTQHHQKGNVYRVSGTMELPHKHVHAQAYNEDLYAALDEFRDTLLKIVERHKDEVTDHHRG